MGPQNWFLFYLNSNYIHKFCYTAWELHISNKVKKCRVAVHYTNGMLQKTIVSAVVISDKYTDILSLYELTLLSP